MCYHAPAFIYRQESVHSMAIKFGTSGWRAILADEFTFPRVRIAVQAIADYLKEERLHNKPVVIGYDTRFLSEDFAKTAAGVLAANGMESLLCVRDTPTPVVAFEVLHKKAAGGIIFTASHNPPTYNGLKFNSAWGGPAPTNQVSVTSRKSDNAPGAASQHCVATALCNASSASSSALIAR